MRYLPIHIDTQDGRIVIVGGGAAAEAKLRTLVKTEAVLDVVATRITPEIARWAEQGRVNHSAREFVESDLDGALLVYAASEDDSDNAMISALARARGIPANAADQKAACSFITPALVDRSPVVVSIGTEGTSPGLARAIKAEFETLLPSTLGTLALHIKDLRAKVKRSYPELAARQRFWAAIFGKGDLNSQLRLSEAALTQHVEMAIEQGEAALGGTISLVGAGPGNPDLLTHQARQKLHSADVVIYDRLVSQGVLDFARREAEYIYVGKEAGGVSTPQEHINALLIEKARQGLAVVRLKGGDPLIFGRADEELDAARAAGIPVEICPGITSAAAAAAAIGQSLTSRGVNKSITYMTGHDTKGFAEQDWARFSKPGARAAIYMGVGAARFIQGRLMLYGAVPTTPVTIVENASRPEQIILATTVSTLPEALKRGGITGPAILLLGFTPAQSVAASLSRKAAL
ncbi:siroheme synthase CysG [Robiginitomaculum antarcticum]|uniref:siroheme synthase CysG n=1 Tax=Robiginitomaculum antarcticum TaxID=437507 RepID=UPI000372F5D3|nr:siroheme synthase CysG [Robiginitomaculum antarcticum]